LEPFCKAVIKDDAAFEVVIELLCQADNLDRYPVRFLDLPEGVSVHAVECFPEVEDLARTSFPESCLLFSQLCALCMAVYIPFERFLQNILQRTVSNVYTPLDFTIRLFVSVLFFYNSRFYSR